MVNTKEKGIIEQQPDIEVKEIDLPDDEVKWCSVALSEVINNSNRFEASAFSLDAKNAREIINNTKFINQPLFGEKGFTKTCFYPGRFKRIYISWKDRNAIGFLGSSEMLEIKPKPEKYLSKNQNDIESLFLNKDDVLISRSGTIGNIAYASKTLLKYLISEHSIRLRDLQNAGYIYAFLKTDIGQTLIKTNTFGSVVNQIEPEHLKNVIIPNPPEILKKEIHNLVVKSYNLRDESNDLIDEAEKMLIEELKLPPIEDFKPKYFDNENDIRNFEVSLSKLNNRFDGSYHIPIIDCIKKHLQKYALSIKYINNGLNAQIILPGRFSRTYVDENQGIKFVGGKDLFQLNPSTEKFLSKRVHEKIIQTQLGIKENDLIMPSRGTIGRLLLAPKHFEGWAISDNLMRITFEDKDIVGYIYCFFNSEYGKVLLEREIYGGVVNAIEPSHLCEIPIPLLKNKEIQTKINNLVLDANKKRYEAYVLEQKAIKMVNEKVIYAK